MCIDMDARTAIKTAKKCRSIIDPIGSLPDFLFRLQKAKESGAISTFCRSSDDSRKY